MHLMFFYQESAEKLFLQIIDESTAKRQILSFLIEIVDQKNQK